MSHLSSVGSVGTNDDEESNMFNNEIIDTKIDLEDELDEEEENHSHHHHQNNYSYSNGNNNLHNMNIDTHSHNEKHFNDPGIFNFT